MRFCRFRWPLAMFFLLVLADPIRGQSPPPFAWWRDTQFQKELGLTGDQSNRIEAVFQAVLPQLRQEKGDLDSLEAELSRLIETEADEPSILHQIDRVEVARGNLNKSRTMMLVHMRQALSPEQRVKFKVLRDQWIREHRPPSRRDSAK